MTTKRIKVGDIEVGVMKNPLPDKTNWVVYRYRARTNEYLSKQEAYTLVQAENLFGIVVGQEELRQKREAERAAAALHHGSFASEGPWTEEAFYQDHPTYARF